MSVDTFYSCVARAAVAAGAGLINDVSGGTLDPLILGTAAQLQVPIVLMHMRGTPGTMTQLASYGELRAPGDGGISSAEAVRAAEEDSVIAVVAAVLQRRAAAALGAGVFAWNIILDPGLGFAKTPLHSYALMRNPAANFRRSDWLDAYWTRRPPTGASARYPAALPVVASSSSPVLPFPLLYGPSRKGFIAAACTVGSANRRVAGPERDWGTAAAVTACVFLGADFVRVHNPEVMHDVVAVADAIHRGVVSSCEL